jgi:hypothetical protein
MTVSTSILLKKLSAEMKTSIEVSHGQISNITAAYTKMCQTLKPTLHFNDTRFYSIIISW